jgi:bacteriocin biosynthesis cyclodehydratase domain-containing protein
MDFADAFRLKRHYTLIAHGPNSVELRSGIWNPVSFTISDKSESGRLYRLLRRLDGSTPTAEIAREESVPRDEVEALINHLADFQAVELAPATALDHYLDDILSWRGARTSEVTKLLVIGDRGLTGQIAAQLADSLGSGAVHLPDENEPNWRVLADSDTAWLRDGLASQEMFSAFEDWREAIVVCAQQNVDPWLLRKVNAVCLHHNVTWLHASADGPVLFIGPTMIPRRSACYECFEQRVVMNLREAGSYQRYKKALAERQVTVGTLPLEPALGSILTAHTVLEAINIFTTGASFTVGKVLAIYLPTMEFSYNEVLRLPDCGSCAPSSERDDAELYFDLGAYLAVDGFEPKG